VYKTFWQHSLFFLPRHGSEIFLFGNKQILHSKFTDKTYSCKYLKISQIGTMLRSFFWFASQGILNQDPTLWPDGARPSSTCIMPFFMGRCPCSCTAYPPTKFITHSDNTFCRLYDFLSPNPLKVKNVVGDFLAKENWKNVRTGKKNVNKLV
jgi:hypothetical protein